MSFEASVSLVLRFAWADVKSGNGNLTLIKQDNTENDYDDTF